jgi:hypothetical protein
MTKISKSPERHTFQKIGYINRQTEAGEPVSEDYLDMYDDTIRQHQQKFADPDTHENNMEYDLLTTDWILEKVRGDDVYAQNLYAVMCNNDFQKNEFMPLLAGKTWSCSWRYAGGIIADMQEKGDYIDWYCSGIRDTSITHSPVEESELTAEQLLHYKKTQAYVGESVVTDEIRADLKRLGWTVIPYDTEDL